MKELLLISYLALASLNVFANKVDELKTDSDVVRFLVTINKNFTSKYSPALRIKSTETIINDNNCDPSIKTWGIKNWQKVDFNNDKRTDLAAIISWPDYINLIVIDKGDDNFQSILLNYSMFHHCEMMTVTKYRKDNVVLYHNSDYYVSRSGKVYSDNNSTKIDTLIYKFGNFVELNTAPVHRDIEAVTFSSGMCYGSCPSFQIKVNRSGQAKYIAGTYSKREGTFNATIKSIELDPIFGLIDYLEIKKLKGDYKVNWTDDATSTLTVKFTDGTEKNISDYGERGTFGLRNLYSKFFALTNSVDWK